MTSNKHKGIRCALVYNDEVAKLSREHNNANILAMGGRVVGAGLALKIAKKINGSVVNADAMQIYKDLSIVTARPTETQNVPHLLYGYLDAYSQGTVQDWLNRVVPILESTKKTILGNRTLFIFPY